MRPRCQGQRAWHRPCIENYPQQSNTDFFWRMTYDVRQKIFTLRASEAAAQCIVIGPVCVFVCVCGSVTTITRLLKLFVYLTL